MRHALPMPTTAIDALRLRSSLRALAKIISDEPAPEDAPYWPILERLEVELEALDRKRSRLERYLTTGGNHAAASVGKRVAVEREGDLRKLVASPAK